jgi:S-DNA-T family DNA segregation ATPase FtsK/SpoIIIE
MMFSMGLMSWLTYTQTNNILTLLPTGTMALVSLLSTWMMYREQLASHKREMLQQEERFEQTLEFKKEELCKARDEEREVRLYNAPGLVKIKTMIDKDDIRLWERRPEDADFSEVRFGVGEMEPATVLKLPDLDPLAPRYTEVYKYYLENRTIKGVPLAFNLREIGSVGMWAENHNRVAMMEVTYALLIHLIALHAPDELHIAIISNTKGAWEWLKWVPHAEPLRPDLAGRSVAIGEQEARILLNDLVGCVRSRLAHDTDTEENDTPAEGPHYLLIIDGYHLVKGESAADYLLQNARRAGVSIIDMEPSPNDVPDSCKAILRLSSLGEVEFASTGAHPIVRKCAKVEDVDRVDLQQATAWALSLAKHHARSSTTLTNIPTNVRLVDALFAAEHKGRVNVMDIRINETWDARQHERWSILLGAKQNNEPVWLNLLESRDGPHGLIAGTTGAGKSVLLESMILSLALTHSPQEINLVLIDFKGGSTAEAFRELPHTVSVITNLQGRLVDRSLAILKAEALRRQTLLRKVDVKDIASYRRRQQQEGWEPLPRLLIVIDEFAEMANAMPSFMDEVNSIAAIGRSLGMHLILATQKPAGVVPDKVWANLKFRLCLRVADMMDSRDLLGVPDAALISSKVPGRGYLRVGSDRFELFQSANALAPYRPDEEVTTNSQIVRVKRGRMEESGVTEKEPQTGSGMSELEVLVKRIRKATHAVPRWPDPLGENLALEKIWRAYPSLLAWRFDTSNGSGLNFEAASVRRKFDERFTIIVGMIDNPHAQTQQPLNLALMDKHYLIVGAPRSGRSTLLRSIVYGLLLNTTPDEVNISLLDFGGQSLYVFEDAPHVANVLGVSKPAHLRRFLSQVSEELDYRAELAAKPDGLDHLPEIVYVIDGYAELRALFPDEIAVFTRVARSGLSLKVHLIITADQIGAVPFSIRNSMSGRLALHLEDSADYADIVGRVRGALPEATPGRGLMRETNISPILEFQAALPFGELDPPAENILAASSEDQIFANLTAISRALRMSWTGERPSRIEILNERIGASELPQELQPGGASWGRLGMLPTVTLGMGDRELNWVTLDYSLHGPHFLVLGPPQSGKTNLLHTWVWNLAERYGPDEVQCTLIGMKNRSLDDLQLLPNSSIMVDNEFQLDALLDDLVELAGNRTTKLKEIVEADAQIAPSVLAKQLGPAHFVFVDDFDAIRFNRDRQSQLLSFARYGRDTRTFLVLAGNTGDLQDFSDLLNLLKRGRYAVMLQPGDMEVRLADVRLPTSALRQEYPTGRGYLLLGNRKELIQTVHLDTTYLAQRAAGLKVQADDEAVATS